MSRAPQTPVKVEKVEGPMEGTKKTHPAFGMIQIHRIQGSPGQLYGSEIKNHGSFIRISIHPGEEHWHLSQTWRHARAQTLAEVDMSAAQFAEAITSFNTGSGVPCTIRFIKGDGEVEGFVDDDTLHEQIKSDIRERTSEVAKGVKDLRVQLQATLAKSGLSKAKQKEILDVLGSAESLLSSSLPFVLDQYTEATEAIKAKAAAEVDALATTVAHKLGLQTLQQLSRAGALALPDSSPPQHEKA